MTCVESSEQAHQACTQSVPISSHHLDLLGHAHPAFHTDSTTQRATNHPRSNHPPPHIAPATLMHDVRPGTSAAAFLRCFFTPGNSVVCRQRRPCAHVALAARMDAGLSAAHCLPACFQPLFSGNASDLASSLALACPGTCSLEHLLVSESTVSSALAAAISSYLIIPAHKHLRHTRPARVRLWRENIVVEVRAGMFQNLGSTHEETGKKSLAHREGRTRSLQITPPVT